MAGVERLFMWGTGLGFVLLASCSSASKKDPTYRLDQLMSGEIRVRRPSSAPADPKAGPGGTDFTSFPDLPGKLQDCEQTSSLVKKIKLEALRECLGKVEDLLTVRYRLRRDIQPEWQLDYDEGKTPECLKELLPTIPVPREMLFLAQEKSNRETSCYASRVDITADRVLGIRFPKSKLDMEIEFPLVNAPRNSIETERMVVGWALTPFFWDEEDLRVHAKRVPTELCRQCFGREQLWDPTKPPPPPWP